MDDFRPRLYDEDNVEMMYSIFHDEHQDTIIQIPNEDKHHNHRKIRQTKQEIHSL